MDVLLTTIDFKGPIRDPNRFSSTFSRLTWWTSCRASILPATLSRVSLRLGLPP